MIKEFTFEPVKILTRYNLHTYQPSFETMQDISRRKISQMINNMNTIRLSNMNNYGISAYFSLDVCVGFSMAACVSIPHIQEKVNQNITFYGYLAGVKFYNLSYLEGDNYILADQSLSRVVSYFRMKDRNKKLKRILK